MVEVIATVLAVLAIFAFVLALLTLYIWRSDPHQFAMWRAELAIWGTELRNPPSASRSRLDAPRHRRLPRLRIEAEASLR